MRKYNKKKNAYRGVLKNKNLSKILESGFNAPVGSTKRKHAQRVLSIMRKMTDDGKGGPGPKLQQPELQLQPRMSDFSQMVVLPPTPKVRVPIGTKAPASYPSYDGQGFTNPFSGLFGGGTAGSGQMTLNLAGNKAAQQGASLVIPKYAPSLASRLAPLASAARATTPLGLASIPAGMMIGSGIEHAYMDANDRIETDWGDPAFRTSGSTPQMINYLPKGQTATGNKKAAEAAAQQPVTWGLNLPGSKAAETTQNTINANPNQYSQPAGPVQLNTGQNNPYEGMDLQGLSAMMAGGNTNMVTPGSQFPNLVQNAVDSNIGPTMFAYQAMQQGADYLNKLPGMQDVPAEVLEGGTLSERLKKMDSTLRKSYGLDEMLNNYADMVKNGANIEGQMTDYIRGRDEFLNETEGLISDLKRASMKADMSDPRTQANMSNHMDYLYEMRGRQNKRYVEFLKMSVDEYSARTTAAENLYKMRFDEYSRELEYNVNMTTEQYNAMFQGLQEMYTTVSEAPLKQLQMDAAMQELNNLYIEGMNDVSDYNGWSSGNYADLHSTLSDVNLIDKDGRWTNNVNGIYAGQDPYAFIPVMQDAVYKSITLPDADGNLPDESSIQSTIGNALGHVALLLEGGYITPDTYNNAESKLRSMAFQALNAKGIIGEDNVPAYREAINALDGKERWYWFDSKTPTKEDFLSKYEGLNKSILSSLYDQMTYYLNEDSNRSASDWVQMKLTARGDLAQGGEPLDDTQLKDNLINNYVNSFQAQNIVPSQQTMGTGAVQQAAGGGTRAQRNNNPLNIKLGGYTANAAGITGVDQKAADDGGNFLIFNSPDSGFQAAKQLLTSDLYSSLTVDQALRKWSGQGYDGKIVPSYSHKIVGSLSDSELDYILNQMATAEGYYA